MELAWAVAIVFCAGGTAAWAGWLARDAAQPVTPVCEREFSAAASLDEARAPALWAHRQPAPATGMIRLSVTCPPLTRICSRSVWAESLPMLMERHTQRASSVWLCRGRRAQTRGRSGGGGGRGGGGRGCGEMTTSPSHCRSWPRLPPRQLPGWGRLSGGVNTRGSCAHPTNLWTEHTAGAAAARRRGCRGRGVVAGGQGVWGRRGERLRGGRAGGWRRRRALSAPAWAACRRPSGGHVSLHSNWPLGKGRERKNLARVVLPAPAGHPTPPPHPTMPMLCSARV